jgi:2'-5' RNA ligase
MPADVVRWTRPDHIHLTLKFMGRVAPDSLPDLEQALRGACQSATSFRVQAEGVGCFPDMKRPRIVWVGIGAGLSALQGLQASIEREMQRWSAPEDRVFRPHLTIGRVKQTTRAAASALAQALKARSAVVLGGWIAEEVELIRSELASEGPHYTRLAVQVLRTVPI